MIHLRYARYVIRHKWFVFVAGLKTRAPIWRLLIHDWSKLTPTEWTPYAGFFYGGEHIPVAPAVKDAFDRAWLHHIHQNPHHWQFWLLKKDDGYLKPLEMPEHFVREMVADWMGAGRAINGTWDPRGWYERNFNTIILHPASRKLTAQLLHDVTPTVVTGPRRVWRNDWRNSPRRSGE